MKVWRLESKDGVGPYTAENERLIKDKQTIRILKNMMRDHRSSSEHPEPGADAIGGKLCGTCIYGCPSFHGLKKWFGEYLYLLLTCGFVIRVFDANEFHIGISGKQVAFNKFKIIDEFDVDSLVRLEILNIEQAVSV